MIEIENLPFSYEDYFSDTENLEELRENIKNLAQRDIRTLEELLSSVQETLHLQLDPESQTKISEIKRKQIEFELFKQLSEQNRQRSESLAELSQLIMQMIDFIQQSQHRYTFLAQSYQTEIDTLRQSIEDLRSGKSLIENDVQIFKEQLERTKNQLDVLLEEKEEEDEEKMQIQYETEQKNSQIEMMEKQLDTLRNKINFFKQTHLNKHIQKQSTLRYTFSEHRFSPLTPTQQTNKTQQNLDYSHYVEFNKVLIAENKELRRRIQELQQQVKTHMNMKQTATSQTYHLGQTDIVEYYQSEETPIRLSQERKTLHNIRSKQSLSSHLDRNHSSSTINLQCWNSEQPPKNRLSSEINKCDQSYDLVPENVTQFNPSKKLIYLTDDQHSLSRDYSRQRYDNFFDKPLRTVYETKQSQISVQQSYKHKGKEIVSLRPKINKASKFISDVKSPKEKASQQCAKEEKNNEKNVLSSVFNYFVKNRVRRTTARANSGCSSFLN